MTEAGKRLLDWFGGPMRPGEARNLGKAILAIEAEARRDLEQRLAAARHAIVQASINLANEDTVAADAEIERARAALAPHDASATPGEET